MKKSLLNLTTLIATTCLLTGCSVKHFVPKQLNDDAKGIATTKSSPYGCKFLGEVEGKEDLSSTAGGLAVGNSYSALREGAMNDLRNNAVEVVAKTQKRTVLKIAEEKAMCENGRRCPENIPEEYVKVLSFHISGEVFECGDK